jgi:Holliday junction resolvase RusA-like endonuclease
MSEESKIVDSLLSQVVIKIDGLPAPGGSKTAFVPTNRKTGEPLRKNGRIIVNVTDAGGRRTRDWKREVARQAKAIFSDKPWACQIEVEFHFTMPRLKSHYGTGAKSSLLRLDAPRMHGVRPDLTKLIRAVEDACTGILWLDDALIVRQLASKRYGERPGVQIAMRCAIQNNLASRQETGLPITRHELSSHLPADAKKGLIVLPGQSASKTRSRRTIVDTPATPDAAHSSGSSERNTRSVLTTLTHHELP